MTRVPNVGEVILERYEIRGIASEGPGYLTVHAFDKEVEVDVSLLWFRPGLFADARAQRAFVGDAVGIRGLTHPHLRRLFDCHADSERCFAAAQVGSASGVIKRLGAGRPADELDVLRYASAIGQGLDAAHQVGAVHGYLVPTDVVEVASQIKLSAVGLYRAASPDVARDLFWTRRKYIAPEVLSGQLPSPASDVFSMGVLLSEIASGISTDDPGDSQDALTASHLRLADVMARATRRDPADRTQTVKEVLAEVRRILVDDRVPTSERKAAAPPEDLDQVFSSFSEVFDALDGDDRDTTVSPGPRREAAQHAAVAGAERAESESDNTVTKRRPALRRPGAEAPGVDLGGGLSTAPLAEEADDDDDEVPTIARLDEVPTMALGDQDATREYQKVAPAREGSVDSDPVPPPAFRDTATIHGVAPPAAALGRSGSAGRSRDNGSAAPPPKDPKDEDLEVELEFEFESDPSLTLPQPPKERPEFVSHKKGDDGPIKTPHIPASERPDLQPRLRPLSSLRKSSVAPGSLGNYAPPREPEPAPPPPPKRRSTLALILWLFAAVLAIVLGALIALVVVRGRADEDAGARRRPAATFDAGAAAVAAADASAAPAIDAAPPGPCPAGMALVEQSELRFCIDRYEAPGKGKTPETHLGRADAERRCGDRGARLCKSAEWKEACRGPEHASYPYADRFDPEICNVKRGDGAEIVAAGSFPRCVSAAGAFDMSGNVAEWTAEGFVHGGSATSTADGRCSRRYRARKQDEGYGDVGYRCCADPLAPAGPSR